MCQLSARKHVPDLEGRELGERSVADQSVLAGIGVRENLPGSQKASELSALTRRGRLSL